MLKGFLGFLFGIWCVAAHAGSNCQHVGGVISTNFLDPNTTLGSATGDLAGGIGVSVLSLAPNNDGSVTFHNQHHWVTSTGDTINAEDAFAVGYPSGVKGIYTAIYTNGVQVTGGTGRFQNASGTLASWGAVNINEGEVVLRYEGTICYAKK